MVVKTLRSMRLGGIWDHVGFGYSRYSTDREWLLPHFEKMLYDQALLTVAHLEAYQATGDEELARTAREILAYVMRDLTSPEGAFYCAEDADSEGEEGKFYVWTPEELRAVLGAKEADFAIRVYGVKPGGNFQDQSTGAKTGESILHLSAPLPAIASQVGMEEAAFVERLEAARVALFAAREKRIRPLRDDKVLADWNGLMIAAFARSAQVLGDEAHAKAARRAAEFLLTHLRGKDGRLLKRWRGGEAALPAVLDDYAFTIWGLIELYEATFEPRWLEEALALEEQARAHFWDAKDGAYFLTADDGEKLPLRVKETYDGALPAGNSVQALNLMRLARLTGRTELEERASSLLRAVSGTVARAPSAHCHLLMAVDFALGPTHEVVVAGDAKAADTQAMLAALRKPYLPNVVLVMRPTGEDLRPLAKVVPYVAGMEPRGAAATAYVCRDFTCSAPTTDIAKALELLAR